MRRLPLLLTLALVAVLAATVPLAYAKTRTVAVADNFFAPKSKTIRKNDTVKFSWVQFGTSHNVKFTKVPRGAKKPRSCGTRESGSCKRKFTKRGTYRYICTIHAASDGMRGKIVVK